MTYEEARKQFWPFLDREDVYTDNFIAAIKTAIYAMDKMSEYELLKERDTAQKPEIFAGYDWRGVIKLCPQCMKPVGSKVNCFCGNCGQKLKWEE